MSQKLLLFVASLTIALIVLAIPTLITMSALAQDPPDSPVPTPAPTEEPLPEFDWTGGFPETAQQGLEFIEAFLVFVSSLATVYLTRWIRKLPLLTENEKSKIAGAGADAVAALVGFVSFGVLTYGAYAAGFLDEHGFWSVIEWIWTVFPATWSVHKVQKISKRFGQYMPGAVPLGK